MRWIDVGIGPVAARVAPLKGRVAQCPDCGRREYYVFRLGSSPRIYMQCCKCDRVEAVDGKPSWDLECYALADAVDEGPIHPLTMPEMEVGGC
jgi:hypothetical protein